MKTTIGVALEHVQDQLQEKVDANEEYKSNEESRGAPNEERLEKYERRLGALEEAIGALEGVDLDEITGAEIEWKGRTQPKEVEGIARLLDIVADKIMDSVRADEVKLQSQIEVAEERDEIEQRSDDLRDAANEIDAAASALGDWE